MSVLIDDEHAIADADKEATHGTVRPTAVPEEG